MELEVYNISGTKTDKKVSLAEDIFSIKPNDNAMYLDVKQIMANSRQGTHASKERNAVTGSRKKIKRQKGTGTARAGDIKSPIFKGGGTVFGPKPREYNSKLNKKLKKLARKSALTYKAKDNNILILEDFVFETPKTKNYIELLNNLKLGDKKTLLIVNESKPNIFLSMRNLKKAKIIRASSLNTYDILDANNLLIVESSIKEIEKVFAQK
jgi:large subunit ribosomal protein L4